jgi:membrane protein
VLLWTQGNFGEINSESHWGGMEVLKRAVIGFKQKNLTDWSAALTYYAVLSLFPALFALLAVLALFGEHPKTTNALLEVVRDVGPPSAVQTFKGTIREVIQDKGDAGTLLAVGLLLAMWSASGYIGVFMRASNIIYEIAEEQLFWKKRALQLAVTIAMVVLLAVLAIALILTGRLAEVVGGVIGLGDEAVSIWSIAKWPVLVVVVTALIALLYYTAPNVRERGFRFIIPGGAVALIVWIAASIAFASYVAYFGSYNKTYGTFGAVIVFFVWLYISNNALLLGAEFNAEMERRRVLKQGPARRGRTRARRVG